MVRTAAIVFITALAVAPPLAQQQRPAFRAPDPLPEMIDATQDFPYLPPPPGARLTETRTVAGPLELRPATADDEAVLAGTSYVHKSYAPANAPSAAPFVVWYRDALFLSGWHLIDATRVDDKTPIEGSVNVSAHYRDRGRNLYARVTQQPDGRYAISVADVGAEDWAAALARECRLRVPSIHFELDTAVLELAESEPTLRKLAGVLAGTSTARVEIQGHMDSIGEAGAAARQELSDKRAQAVMAWLTLHGAVPAAKLTAKGYGRSRPTAENDTDLGRALNRRIEIAPEGCSR
jgi:outer membrane protein OmpA-like peptidoglycan-associated protein